MSAPRSPKEALSEYGIAFEAFSAGSSGAGWDAPAPLRGDQDLPGFPTEVLSPWLGEFVEAEALGTQTPVDMSAMVSLGVLSTLTGGRVNVEARSGWVEPVHVWVAVGADPGERKTAVYRDGTEPILSFEREQLEAAKPVLAEAASKRRAAERHLDHLEREFGKESQDDRSSLDRDRAEAVAALADLPVPEEPKLFTDDATPEALSSLLHAHGGRMAILSAEGGVFGLMAGRYNNGVPNLDIYLKGHAGDAVRVSRSGRPGEYIPHPALTICVAVQPLVLQRAARIPEMKGRGLLDRFFYALPRGRVGYRDVNPPPLPDAVRSRYARNLRQLATSLHQRDQPYLLTLSSGAAALLADWMRELEPRRRPDADLGHIRGWASKLDGATVRIAGLLHLAEHVGDGWERPIHASAMTAAIEVARYLTIHALAVFELMGADPAVDNARRILRWIQLGGRQKFTRHECHRSLASHFPRAVDFDAPLRVLEDHGWIRRLPDEARVGRPTIEYEVNPHALAQGRDRDNTDETRHDSLADEGFVGFVDGQMAAAAVDPISSGLGDDPVGSDEPADAGEATSIDLRAPYAAVPAGDPDAHALYGHSTSVSFGVPLGPPRLCPACGLMHSVGTICSWTHEPESESILDAARGNFGDMLDGRAMAGWRCYVGPGHEPALRADGTVFCGTCHPVSLR